MWEVNAGKLLYTRYTAKDASRMVSRYNDYVTFFFQTKFIDQVKIQATLETIGKQVRW